MHKPLKLQNGDRIRIVIPASPVKPDLFEKGLSTVRSLGLEPVCGRIDRKWRYLAGTDEERFSELQAALNEPDTKAIFFARGGYGSLRLISYFPATNYQPKILLGCSDITTLHQYFSKLYDWVLFHGPMPSGDFARGQLHVESLQKAMMQTSPYELAPAGVETLQSGEAEGKLMGGCLTLLEASIGTRWEPDWRDSLLFFEDVSTKPYQIDRMLTHLKLLGKFHGVRAFIFGEMKDCIQVENQGYTLQEVILDILGNFHKPIYFGFPSGHVNGLNWTLPMGVRARVSAKPSFSLEILESAVQ